jgi:CRISPR-associated protein Csb2
VNTTLAIRFLLGRYHATPWARHVNEGQVELPPSPWRLLRTLYAVWQTRVPDLDAGTVHDLLRRLAEPPEYFVSPHTIAHTRHYYPDSKSRSGTPSTDRTLDAFAAVDRQAELAVRWRFDLPGEQAKVLARLADSLPYLGRADSLCEAVLDPTWERTDEHRLWSPADVGESVPADAEAVTLLAPTLPLDMEALTLRPVDVRAGRLLFPLGTHLIGYYAEPRSLGTRPRPRTRIAPGTVAEAVRFTITSRVRPPETDAVAMADLLRNTAVRRLCKLRNDEHRASLLAGRDGNEQKMTGHQHAHFLALPDDQRRLGELVVWAPAGLAGDELDALASIPVVQPPQGMPGPRAEVRISGYGPAREVLADLTGPAVRWESVTPFVPMGRQNRGWSSFVAAEIRRELSFRDRQVPAAVEVRDGDWRSYIRYRPTRRFAANEPDRRSGGRGEFLTLTFPTPITGPLALGALSHFGLGLFRPTPAG